MGVNSIMNDAGRIGFVIKGDYSNAETYDFLDLVYFNGATYVAKKLTVGNTPDNTEFWHIFADGNIDVNDVAPTFLQAETRENINSGEKLPVIFGKIKKFFTDLKTVAFTGSYNDLSNKPSASDIGAMPDIITVTEYPYNGITDVLKLPIGRYRFPDYGVWNSFENVPNINNGILEISSNKKGEQDPWSDAWKYKNFVYKTSANAIVYVRTLNSGATPGTITDSGWLKVTTSKDILDTTELISANTASGNVAGALALKEVIKDVDTKMTLSLKPFNGDITANEIFEIIKNKTDTYFSWVSYNDVKYNPLGTSGNWQYEILNVYTNNVSYLYLKATKINTGEQWIYTKNAGWTKTSLGNKKYGTLTVVNANGKEYSYVRSIGGEFGVLKITCLIPAIEAWEESIIYTSDIKPTNEIVFMVVDQNTSEIVRCLFNTSGQVIAQAREKAYAGGWIGGSCTFM